MKFGCCVEPQLLPFVRNAGYDFAELRCAYTFPDQDKDAWREQQKSLLATGIPIHSFNVLLTKGFRVVGPAVNHQALAAYLEIVFQRMQDVGARYVSFGSGAARAVPAGFPTAQAWQQLREFVTQLGELGRRYEIMIHIEPLNRTETNIIHTVSEAAQLAQEVDLPTVLVLADLYHMMMEKEDLMDLVTYSSWVGYVHVADSQRRFPGSGQYPYQQLADILKNSHYDGPISVECRWQEPEWEIEKSLLYLHSVFD